MGKSMTHYLVTGTPRTGSSMMMRCLEFGGIPAAADKTDPEFGQGTQMNKYGCYEIGRANTNTPQYTVMQMFREFPDMCIKIDMDRIMFIPLDVLYRVVFMIRSAKSVRDSMLYQSTVSIKRGLLKRAEAERKSGERFNSQAEYDRIIGERVRLLSQRANVIFQVINYDTILARPVEELQRLKDAGWPIDVKEAIRGVEPEEKRF